MDDVAPAAGPALPAVVIKKYANRRLYNTGTSSYITLDHLATMTRAGHDFQVFDAKTGEDITHNVLTQIVMEGESGGQTMLPVPFLRQLIALYGDSMQSMVPHYLEASMAAFAKNQAQFREQVADALSGGVIVAAADMLTGRAALGVAAKPAEAKADVPAASELEALKVQMAALQAQLDKLSK